MSWQTLPYQIFSDRGTILGIWVYQSATPVSRILHIPKTILTFPISSSWPSQINQIAQQYLEVDGSVGDYSGLKLGKKSLHHRPHSLRSVYIKNDQFKNQYNYLEASLHIFLHFFASFFNVFFLHLFSSN